MSRSIDIVSVIVFRGVRWVYVNSCGHGFACVFCWCVRVCATSVFQFRAFILFCRLVLTCKYTCGPSGARVCGWRCTVAADQFSWDSAIVKKRLKAEKNRKAAREDSKGRGRGRWDVAQWMEPRNANAPWS